MRIGIDGSCLTNRRGFGRATHEIVHGLARAGTAHELVLVLDRPSVGQVEVPRAYELAIGETRAAQSRAASARGRRSLSDMLAMGRAAARARLDLMFFPATFSFFPVWNVPRVVVTVHDALALKHPELVFPTRRGRWAWWLKERLAVAWSDRVVTVSEASRRDLARWYGVSAERARVVRWGPAPCFTAARSTDQARDVLRRHGLSLDEPYILYVGGLSPHKNLPRLIEAFARAGAAAHARLAIVGDFGDVFHTEVPALRAAIARHGLEDRARLTGFVPDAELAHLYQHAVALAQPSLMEGFGLPPIEAMACGTPVLFSRAGSLPEVVGDAGLGFDPTDVAGMAEAIRSILAGPALRDRLAERARRRARLYTWAAAAQTLLDCFEELGPQRPAARAAPPRAARPVTSSTP